MGGRARARGSDEAGGGQGLDPSGAAADAVGGVQGCPLFTKHELWRRLIFESGA